MNNIVLQFDKLVVISREVEVGDNELRVRVAYLYPRLHEYSLSGANVFSTPSGSNATPEYTSVGIAGTSVEHKA